MPHRYQLFRIRHDSLLIWIGRTIYIRFFAQEQTSMIKIDAFTFLNIPFKNTK